MRLSLFLLNEHDDDEDCMISYLITSHVFIATFDDTFTI